MVLPEKLILGEVHLLRHRPSLKTKLNSNQHHFCCSKPCCWNVMTNSLSDLGMSTKICLTEGTYVKPLARNKVHTCPPR